MTESTAVTTSRVRTPVPAGDSIDSLFRLAEALVPTGFLPANIKTAGQAVAIILAGKEIGLMPMQSLRSISLVQGKVTINADMLLALFVADGGKAEWTQSTIAGATIKLTHTNGTAFTSSFTSEDAKRAGLAGKQGPWSSYPQAMLRARAITAGLKAIGWQPAAGVYDSDSGELPEPAASAQVVEGGGVRIRGSLPASTPPLGPASTGAYGDEIELEDEFARRRARVEALLEDPALPDEFRSLAVERMARKPLTRKSVVGMIAALEEKIAEATRPKDEPETTAEDGGLGLPLTDRRADHERNAQAAGL